MFFTHRTWESFIILWFSSSVRRSSSLNHHVFLNSCNMYYTCLLSEEERQISSWWSSSMEVTKVEREKERRCSVCNTLSVVVMILWVAASLFQLYHPILMSKTWLRKASWCWWWWVKKNFLILFFSSSMILSSIFLCKEWRFVWNIISTGLSLFFDFLVPASHHITSADDQS